MAVVLPPVTVAVKVGVAPEHTVSEFAAWVSVGAANTVIDNAFDVHVQPLFEFTAVTV
jgi:hypothetical protein